MLFVPFDENTAIPLHLTFTDDQFCGFRENWRASCRQVQVSVNLSNAHTLLIGCDVVLAHCVLSGVLGVY